MNVEIEASDVVKVVLQWCREAGLEQTATTLQREARVALNTSPGGRDALLGDVKRGRWDAVLPQVATMELPRSTLEMLYEQIILEMAELKEADTARALLRQTQVMAAMKERSIERHARLEKIVSTPYFDALDAYGGESKEKRREKVAGLLKEELVDVAPGRLLALIGQALKWQQNTGELPPGTKFDLFANAAMREKTDEGPSNQRHIAEEERPCSVRERSIRLSKKAHGECVAFSSDGAILATGSSDGFIELWDWKTGKLRKDLQFQADDAFMMHEDSVLCLSFSRDSDLLASGSLDGRIKVWKVLTGQLLRQYDTAHSGGVVSLQFSRDGSHLLSSSSDSLARVHGLKSGRMLKELRGHDGALAAAVYSADCTRVATAGRDGKIKIWDAKSGDCLLTFTPPQETEALHAPVLALHIVDMGAAEGLTETKEALVVCSRSATIHIMSLTGELLHSIQRDDEKMGELRSFESCMVSPGGALLYAIAADRSLACFSLTGGLAGIGRTECVIQEPHGDKELVGMAHHPHRNMLVSVGVDGCMNMFRAIK